MKIIKTEKGVAGKLWLLSALFVLCLSFNVRAEWKSLGNFVRVAEQKAN